MRTIWTMAFAGAATLAFAAGSVTPGLARADDHAEKAVPAEPDNTGVNVRDREGATLTPVDQGTSEADVERTRKIRSTITSTDGMSMQARNVKVITRDGAVTLRGPVESAQERAAIEAIAREAGATRVDNQLEIDEE